MEEAYRKIVEHIFNNWSALQLAVEHLMGGPNSKQVAVDTVDYLVKYVTSEINIEAEDIEDVLIDIMEEEFHTSCEDNSIREVSELMMKFITLIKKGETNAIEVEYNKLPASNQWLSKSQCMQEQMPHQKDVGEASSSTTSQYEPMEEEDPGWTQVRTRKRH